MTMLDTSDLDGSDLAAGSAPPSPEALLAQEVRAQGQARRRSTTTVLTGRVGFAIGVALLWQLGSGRIVDSLFVSDPISIAAALWELATDGDLAFHLRFTVIEVVAGYTVGAVLGVSSALVLSMVPRVKAVLQPFLVLFYSIPKVALAPLVIMWFGLGLSSKVMLAGLFVYFVMFMNTLGGVEGVSTDLLNVSRVMGATRLQLMRKVILPSAVPNILTGLHICIPLAMVGAVLGELLAGNRGVGYLISRASYSYNAAGVFAGIIAILGVVLVLNGVVMVLERRLLSWRPRGLAASEL